MASCKTLARVLLYFINFFVFLISSAMVGIGVWATVRFDEFKKMSNEDEKILRISTYLCIAIGLLNFVTSCCGCCGAGLKSVCCLTTSIVLCIVSLLLLVACATLIIVFRLQKETDSNAMQWYRILVIAISAVAGLMVLPIIAASVIIHKVRPDPSDEEYEL